MAAVFTSIGYPGTIEPGAEWARAKSTAGGTYGVVGAGDWKVTIKPAADRTASIAAGAGFRGGIDDTTVGVGEVTFGTLTSGTRYDLVVARSIWGGTNETSFVVISGSSTRGLPARSTTPGTQDDQPLALARIAGGVGGGVLAEIIDLRCWQSNGGAVGADDLVRSYLTDVGTELWIGSTLWRRYVDALGSPAWGKTVTSASLPVAFYGQNGALSATSPAGDSTVWLVQTGTSDRTTDSSGVVSFAFPTAFPNGVLSVAFSGADDLSTPDMNAVLLAGSTTKTGAAYRLWASDQAFGATRNVQLNKAHKVSFIAIGW